MASNPPAAPVLPLFRTRLALALICLAVVALELTFMRGLALRFWSHFACMVISVGLLGFGAAGSFLTLFRTRILVRQREVLCGLAFALAASIPLMWWASQIIPLDVGFLAWSFSQAGNVLAIELVMFVPFMLGGMFVGVVLMDVPVRISGHYACDLLGSGAGGVAAVLAMNLFSTVQLIAVLTGLVWVAALFLLPAKALRSAFSFMLVLTATILTLFGLARMPWDPAISPYKYLALARTWQGTQVLEQTEGPLGRIDVLAGPAIHFAPGLSLQYSKNPPPHVLMITDGDGVSPVYDVKSADDWKFLDYRTAALPFHLQREDSPRVCIVGAGGGAEIGLALYHHSSKVTALEMNPQIIDIMEGLLKDRGGYVYRAPGVQIVNQEARGFFAATSDKFDIIQLPPVDGFGASGSGLFATQESYLYTVESMGAMLDHLSTNGVLCVTRWARTPPREELRAFDMAAQALRKRNLDPATHLVMLRNWVTASVLAFNQPVQDAQIAQVRAFCKDKGFDLCYLPGLRDDETNLYHVVNHTYYVDGPKALLGGGREDFLARYPFDIAAPTDDKPYFFHSFRWQGVGKLQEQLGGGNRAFLEVGYLMLVAALVQTVLLGLLLVLLPMAPGLRTLKQARGKTACLGYFLMLGLGFMLLEMSFVQKLVLYLSHPIYAAAVVIASFLVFAGLGSELSGRWRMDRARVIVLAAGGIVLISCLFLVGMDRWLDLTQSWSVFARCLIAAFTIAPLAFAMGHLFPLGLQRVAQNEAALVPWAWAINGFASVVATAATPLLAMQFGFSHVVMIAIGCYALAAIFFRLIPTTHTTPSKAPSTADVSASNA